MDVVVDSVAKLNDGATMDGVFVSTAGGASGSVEPIAWLSGRLYAEYDDILGPYNGTWAVHPTLDQLTGRNLAAPQFTDTPRGALPLFIAWFSGEVRLDNGAQKIKLGVSPNATAFVDILRLDGTELVHCPSGPAECNVNAPAAGWYPIRIGWRRPAATGATLLLEWAATGAPVRLDAATRLRTALPAQLTGSRVEGFTTPRGLHAADNATLIDTDKPIDLVWEDTLFDLQGSSSYRSTTQLRIAESGTYDLVVDANGGTSYRLWLDGEWATDPDELDYIDDAINPPPVTISRSLSAGWHDVVLEGYDTRGTSGIVTFTLARTGQTQAAPSLAATRPVIGAAPRIAHVESLTDIQLESDAAVSATLAVAPLAATSPVALAVDVSLTLKPANWNGLQIKIYPPGAAAGLPLTFDTSGRGNNTVGEVSGSLTKTALGATPVNAQGDWKVEVTHGNSGGLDATNVISDIQLHVHYAGAAGVTAAAPLVRSTSSYTRMFALDKEHELRGLLAETIKPANTSIALGVQLCSDAMGASCQPAITDAQLAATRPSSRYVKAVVTFTSDGFAVPILNKLVLRHRK